MWKSGEKEVQMKIRNRFILAIILNLIIVIPALAKINVKEAMVKIYSVYNEHSYYEPWQMKGQQGRSGSGCIIREKRILTNAHVVGDQTFIQVRRAGEAKKYTAEVEIVAHECDLAIIKVSDESFFSDVNPLEIGQLAEVRDKVAVYGFPIGGDELCITEGVVSRVEHRAYTQSNAYLLTCQIDAAINPGSSGGPVIKDDKIIGVAFQSGTGENIGYMVPSPVINHFLKDISDGQYDGIPDIGISAQKMENPDIRLKFSMTEGQTGILVNKIYPDSPAKGMLKSGDIILSIDNKDIANDGTIEFRKGERTSYQYLAQQKYINDKVKIKILREGELKEVDITLTQPINFERLVPHSQYDVPPQYYILGGMVFEPLSLNFLQEWGGEWYMNAPLNLRNYYYYGEPIDDRRQVIVLVRVLADEINVGYHDWGYNVISYVNGKKISTMKDLIEAFEEHKGKYHIVQDEGNYQLILDKEKVDKYSQRILERYRINSDRSEDLIDR